MKTTLLLALIIVLASSQCPDWREFKERFNKVYPNSAAEIQAEAAYQENARKVAEHNADPNASFTRNCNQFSDLTEAQAANKFGLGNKLKYVKTANPQNPTSKALKGSKLGAIPASVDWRVEGIITSIKNQGTCGSCWAFTSTAAVQASYVQFNSTTYGNSTTDFSEEYTLQCTTQNSPGSTVSDCGGGILEYAIPFLLRTGMPTETSFPYAAGSWAMNTAGTPTSSGICTTTSLVKDPNHNPTFNTNYENLTNAQMKDTLAYNPTTGAMYAGGAFMTYSGGVYTGCPTFDTSVGQLNHAVLIIGYDSSGNYIIKNSWGTSWGENGYATISAANDCGLSHIPRQIRGTNAQLTFERTIFLAFVFLIAFFLI